MKTFADLKRDLQVGDKITLVEAPTMPNHRFLNIPRFVVRKQTNGVYLGLNKNEKTGSWLEFKNAKLTEYDGKTLKIYRAGNRPLTEEERHVYDNRPSKRPENRLQMERDLLSGSSVMFWRDKAYFKNKKMDYLHYGSNNRYIFHSHNMTIEDAQIKGQLELSYVIEKQGV